MSSEAYEVRLMPDAVCQLGALDAKQAQRIGASLKRQATRVAVSPGSRGGKSVKTLRGRHDRLYRLRVGELRVAFDLIHDERVLRVLGIVNRRDLDRWLRSRRSS